MPQAVFAARHGALIAPAPAFIKFTLHYTENGLLTFDDEDTEERLLDPAES